MCKKQTSVSHSSTESEVISLDAGLRIDGLPALDLCEVVKEVLHSLWSQQPNKHRETCCETARTLLVAGHNRCYGWGPGAAHRRNCGSAGLRGESHLISSPRGHHGGSPLRSHWGLSPNDHGRVRRSDGRSLVPSCLHTSHCHCSRSPSQA